MSQVQVTGGMFFCLFQPLSRCVRSKFVPYPSSFSYKRMLTLVMENGELIVVFCCLSSLALTLEFICDTYFRVVFFLIVRSCLSVSEISSHKGDMAKFQNSSGREALNVT